MKNIDLVISRTFFFADSGRFKLFVVWFMFDFFKVLLSADAFLSIETKFLNFSKNQSCYN